MALDRGRQWQVHGWKQYALGIVTMISFFSFFLFLGSLNKSERNLKMEQSELLLLLEKQGAIIDEKIKSEKVVAGLLKDITESLDRIAGAIEEHQP